MSRTTRAADSGSTRTRRERECLSRAVLRQMQMSHVSAVASSAVRPCPGHRRARWDDRIGLHGTAVHRGPASGSGVDATAVVQQNDRRADLADSVGGRVSEHRPGTGGGGPGTVAADRPPVTDSQMLSAPPRRRRTTDGATRPARRLAVTAVSFALFSTAAFGVVAATAPEVIGFSPTAGSLAANHESGAPPGSTGGSAQPPGEPAVDDSGGMAARPAAPPRNGRVAGPGSTESDPGSGRSDPVARGAVPGVGGTASASPSEATTGGATPGGQSNPAPSTSHHSHSRDPDTSPPSRGPIGAYVATPTGSSETPTSSDRPSGTPRPGTETPGSGTASAQPTRTGSPTPEADGG